MTDLKRIYQKRTAQPSHCGVPVPAGQGQPGGCLLAGNSHHGQGAEDVGEHRAPGCAGSSESWVPHDRGTVSVESCRLFQQIYSAGALFQCAVICPLHLP